MIDDEPTAASRRIPLDLDDGAGAEYTGVAPTGVEVLISIRGAAFAQAAGTVTKLRNGDFYYEATRAETAGRGMRLLRLAKSGLGTVIFEFQCGSRRAAEPDAMSRRVPIMLEVSGTPVTGVTLSGAEIEISTNGAAFATAAGTSGEIGYGAYYYEPTAAEHVRGHSVINVNDAAADEYKFELVVDQAYLPAMANATTATAIRDRMLTVICGLTPASDSSIKFIRHETAMAGDFIAWAESNPAAAYRRVDVRYTRQDDHPETSSGLEEEHQRDFTVMVAYPLDYRYGGNLTLDRDDVIDEDQKLIKKAIGMLGKANFTPPYPDATWLAFGENTDGVDGEACAYLQITLRMAFVESLA